MTHPGATHCDNCGLTWLDDGLNPLSCPYCALAQERKRLDWALTVDAIYRDGCLIYANNFGDGSRVATKTKNPRAAISVLTLRKHCTGVLECPHCRGESSPDCPCSYCGGVGFTLVKNGRTCGKCDCGKGLIAAEAAGGGK